MLCCKSAEPLLTQRRCSHEVAALRAQLEARGGAAARVQYFCVPALLQIWVYTMGSCALYKR